MLFDTKLRRIAGSCQTVEGTGNPFAFIDAVNSSLDETTKNRIAECNISLRVLARILKRALASCDANKTANDLLDDSAYIISQEQEVGRL